MEEWKNGRMEQWNIRHSKPIEVTKMKKIKHYRLRQPTIFLVFAFSLLSLFPAPISAGVFQTMGGPNGDEAVAIVNQTANGYRIIANRHEYDPVSRTIRVLQMDRSGAVIATDSYSSTYDPAARYATNTADGGFALASAHGLIAHLERVFQEDAHDLSPSYPGCACTCNGRNPIWPLLSKS